MRQACKGTMDDAHALVSRAHRGALLVLARKSGEHSQGLTEASKKIGIAANWKKSLADLDVCRCITAKISEQSVAAFLANLQDEIDGKNARAKPSGIFCSRARGHWYRAVAKHGAVHSEVEDVAATEAGDEKEEQCCNDVEQQPVEKKWPSWWLCADTEEFVMSDGKQTWPDTGDEYEN